MRRTEVDRNGNTRPADIDGHLRGKGAQLIEVANSLRRRVIKTVPKAHEAVLGANGSSTITLHYTS